MSAAQSYENHAKMVTGYHYLLSLFLLVLIVWAVRGLAQGVSVDSVIGAVFVAALALVGFYTRTFALGVQDRVIRLEERLRMEHVLPEELRGRSAELTTDQLVGLRFASDEELPGLVREVLEGRLTDRKAIKKAVKSWRADHQRI